MYWETIRSKGGPQYIRRSWVPGGWLIRSLNAMAGGLTFYPDPEHKWQPAVKDGAPWRK